MNINFTSGRVFERMVLKEKLYSSLLESYPARLEAVKKAGGGHTKY